MKDKVIFVVLFLFLTGGSFSYIAAADSDAGEQRRALEDQLVQLEQQIVEQEGKITEYRKQGKTLQSEVKQLESKVAKLNLQIKAINLTLQKLDTEITDTEKKIDKAEDDIALNKKNISTLIQSLYENDNKSLAEIILVNPSLSGFFRDINNLSMLQDNLREVLQKIVEDKKNLVDAKEALALEREDADALKAYQESQRKGIKNTQDEKSSLLAVTKGKESEYQKILSQTKKTAAEVRKQIFALIGGGELAFSDAYKLAKIAEQATGVRAALILAVLDRESALGKNVGQCDYKTAMHPKRDIPIFLEIVRALGLQSNLERGILKVSCANSDGAYGGAMGPAQFIPSTWVLYKDEVAKITGNSPPSPWKNEDAFVATALLLKDAGASNGSLSQERAAAAKYYAGSRWRNYLWTYGERVVAQAQRFEEDIAILSS